MKKRILIISIVVLILIVCGVISFLAYKQKIYENKDVDKYEQYLDELRSDKNVYSKLFIFPDKVTKGDVEEFRYLKKNGNIDNSYMFYIIIKYEEMEYNKEIERLKKIKRVFNGANKYIIYEDKLKYPAYITINDGLDTYEYALIDNKNKKIIYVFRQLFNSKIDFNEEYLLNYNIPKDKRDKNSLGYNMYYFYNEFGIGYMEGYENK